MKPIDFDHKKINRFKNPPEGEQELVREFFHHKHDGFYVDVGANEPIIESQTYHLDKTGWNGLLLEPLPNYCSLLEKERTGTVVQCACSSRNNHNTKMKLIVAGGHSTLEASPIAMGDKSQETIEVTSRTLDSVLEEYNVSPGFEFLSIDIEGHEMEMFDGFSLSKWKPQLVLLEDHVINHEKHNHMLSNGYQLLCRTGLNSWYAPSKNRYTLSLTSSLEFIRKYWLGLIFRKLKYRK